MNPDTDKKPKELAPETLDTIVDNNFLAWWVYHGAIQPKEGSATGNHADGKKLVPNAMQRIIGDVVRWFRSRELPVRIISLKPRQRGSSTIFMGLFYHYMSSAPEDTVGRIVGGNEEQPRTMIEMVEKYAAYDRHFPKNNSCEILPRGLRGKWKNGSELKGDTLGGKSNIVGSMNPILVGTEGALWDCPGDDNIPDASERWDNIAMTVPYLPHTVIIEESTARGATGMFYNHYMKAEPWEQVKKNNKFTGVSSTVSLFFPWHIFDTTIEIGEDLSPEEDAAYLEQLFEDEKQYRKQVANETGAVLSGTKMKWRRWVLENRCSGSAEKFDRDYPYSVETAFTKSGSPRFTRKCTSILRRNAKLHPLPEYGNFTMQGTNPFSRKDNVSFDRVHSPEEASWWIYERPLAGCRYFVVDDPSLGKIPKNGTDPDNSGIAVFRAGYRETDGRWHPLKLVASACLYDGKKNFCLWPPDTAERELWKASKYYGGVSMVPIVIEIPIDDGLNRSLKEKGAPLYVQRKANSIEETEESSYGFRQTAATKADILGQLEQRLAENFRADDGGILDGGGIDIPDMWTIDEIENMVRKPDGTVQAGRAHDDKCIAVAIACAVEKSAQPHVPPVTRMDRWQIEDARSALQPIRRGNFW